VLSQAVKDDRREGGRWVVENMVLTLSDPLPVMPRSEETHSQVNLTPRVLRVVMGSPIVEKDPQIGWNVVGSYMGNRNVGAK
jgi:hypothetical protein